ncbi:hypothetical protein BJ878DRAFT_493838 [Calycina marina]|uniref:Uncharacterized protein n=1 Tax=Calycina marina TaxID=1763456 RepID=A0A9P7Z7V2_9HELO|nr:hypothetical protein BJ878DRAFT_493838 [Calycina marina]
MIPEAILISAPHPQAPTSKLPVPSSKAAMASRGELVKSTSAHQKTESTSQSIPYNQTSATRETKPLSKNSTNSSVPLTSPTTKTSRNGFMETAIARPNPDPRTFKTLVCDKSPTKRIYQLYSPFCTAPETLYTIIEADRTFRASKPDIRLFAGTDKTAPLAGVVKLHSHHAKEYVLGIGDPDVLGEAVCAGKGVMWESLRRAEKWRFGTYVFEFGGGKARRMYTWRRTVRYWSRFVKDMELRVGGVDESEGEVVALWSGSSWHNLKRGSLYVQNRGESAEEQRQWEVTVVLAAMAIIETAVRRSRS